MMDTRAEDVGRSSEVRDEGDGGPLWNYVEKISKNEGEGNHHWVCTICGKESQGSYTRVKAHLLKLKGKGVKMCLRVTPQQVQQMTNLQNEYVAKMEGMASKAVSLPTGPSKFIQVDGLGVTKKRKTDSTIGKAFDTHTRNELGCRIARMFYTGGLPFNLARNPHYLASYAFAANNNLGGYIPPSYNRIRTTLLEQEKKHIVLSLIPIKSTWTTTGVTIMSDGWSDPTRRPLINFMVVSESGSMFMKAVDCAGVVKDAQFIANLLQEVIVEVGIQNVVQVITDNASNCKRAGQIIEGIYPSIYWTPCVVHTLNLALKNICAAKDMNNNEVTFGECHWITEIYNEVVQIKNFIMN